MSRHDLIIAGGGIAGLTAAAAFGANGFSVLIVDPAPPVIHEADPQADLRSTAFLQPAQRFLEKTGIWPLLAPHATPLETMRIIDAGGPTGAVRRQRDFNAREIGALPFGWNLPNWLLRRELSKRLDELENVTFLPGKAVTGFLGRTTQARVTLSDGTHHRARLVLAADGRNSPLRQMAGIGARTTRFGQKALAFAVTHPVPHDNISTEIHRSGGPFTLVPLPDRDGHPASAVVWMENAAKADALARLDDAAFADRLLDRSCGVLGPLTPVTGRSVWPIIAQRADALTAARLALVAEAAHVVPPIGAQGLNMSLADISWLFDAAMTDPESMGSQEMLDRFAKARMPDIRLRVAGITALNRASQAGAPILRDLRGWGLDLLHGLPGVRAALMDLGLGAKRAPG